MRLFHKEWRRKMDENQIRDKRIKTKIINGPYNETHYLSYHAFNRTLKILSYF